MINRINQIMELANKEKYLVLKQAIYKEKNYYVALQVTDDEENITEKVVVFEQVNVNGQESDSKRISDAKYRNFSNDKYVGLVDEAQLKKELKSIGIDQQILLCINYHVFFTFIWMIYDIIKVVIDMQKTFKTLDEQIEILKSKGLTINDYEKTKEILFRENYFFVNGYRHLLTDSNGKFVKGATFDELYSIFIFDRRLRNIFFKNIMIIENNIKSIISYQLSKKYGYKEKNYLDYKNFDQESFKLSQVNDNH